MHSFELKYSVYVSILFVFIYLSAVGTDIRKGMVVIALYSSSCPVHVTPVVMFLNIRACGFLEHCFVLLFTYKVHHVLK